MRATVVSPPGPYKGVLVVRVVVETYVDLAGHTRGEPVACARLRGLCSPASTDIRHAAGQGDAYKLGFGDMNRNAARLESPDTSGFGNIDLLTPDRTFHASRSRRGILQAGRCRSVRKRVRRDLFFVGCVVAPLCQRCARGTCQRPCSATKRWKDYRCNTLSER